MLMPDSAKPYRLWLSLICVAGMPRLLCAFLLPNAFGDAYAYIRDIGTMSALIRAGNLRLTDLYGFWLPFYQLICAGLSAAMGHPFYVGKVVSALFGTGICLLVYDTALRLTARRRAAWLAFALVALSPLHIFNSASAMTDVPHAFFVVASACFVLRKRWVLAGVFAALAGLTRVDSWMLILLIPLIQFMEDRRVSPASCAIMLLPPLFWFYISWKAAGDWLACFAERKRYMDWLLAANPSLASFSLYGIARDLGALLLSTDLSVLLACLFAAWTTFRPKPLSSIEPEAESCRAAKRFNLFFLAFLSFMLLAYATHKQPIIFPRYGLILFVLGAPVLPWAYLRITRQRPRIRGRLLAAIIALSLLNASIQLAYSIGYINRELAHGRVASFLRSQFRPGMKIFNDDSTILALSEIPAETFHSSTDAPLNREGFLDYLRDEKVEYLVYVNGSETTPARLFPELRRGGESEIFQPVMHAYSGFLHADIWLYKVRPRMAP
jgi:hypothetical protein